MKLIQLAQICHEANKSLCAINGDHTQPKWGQTTKEIRDSALNGVKFHLMNPDATPENSHESWLAEKEENGWTYGEVKSLTAKTHPCFRPYEELPETDKAKDYLFRSTIHALASFIDEDELAAL